MNKQAILNHLLPCPKKTVCAYRAAYTTGHGIYFVCAWLEGHGLYAMISLFLLGMMIISLWMKEETE